MSVSQDYSIVDKQGDAALFFGLFDIPLTENCFWYRYEGTLKAGVSLETTEIDTQRNSLTITLDPAYIISNTPDIESSGVLEECNSALNPIQAGDVDEFRHLYIERGRANAIESGILGDGQEEVVAYLTQLFYAALGGEASVEFVWRKAPV